MVVRLVLVLKYFLEGKNGAIYRGIFLVLIGIVSFCLVVGIIDNMLLFFLYWNAIMFKVMIRIKCCYRFFLYYFNCSAIFRCVMIYEIVFKLNLGFNGVLIRNLNNFIVMELSGMLFSDNRLLKICCLNVRSLRNKLVGFVELVNDLKVNLFIICEIWLSVNDSVVFNEFILIGYNILYYCL